MKFPFFPDSFLFDQFVQYGKLGCQDSLVAVKAEFRFNLEFEGEALAAPLRDKEGRMFVRLCQCKSLGICL